MVTKEPDNRPRVFWGTPSYGNARMEAARLPVYTTTRGLLHPIPGDCTSSALVFNYNRLWAQALNMRRDGIIDYFLMQHDDIQINTLNWMDALVGEMAKTGAAVVSVVVAMKGEGRETSTAIEQDSHWGPRRLTLDECWALPETFCAADTIWPDRALLVNNGLMLVDLRRPEFSQKQADGTAKFFFFNDDKVVQKENGEWAALFASEDWNFSRQCHAAGLPVFATRKIDVIHHGGGQWSNQKGAA